MFHELRGFVATVLIFVVLVMKSHIEEKFMVEQFGSEYQAYIHRVKALIPFVY